MEAQRQRAAPKSSFAKRKTAGSDFSSVRGSEERHSSVPVAGRGTKRGRDMDLDKVRFGFSSAVPLLDSQDAGILSFGSLDYTDLLDSDSDYYIIYRPHKRPRQDLSHIYYFGLDGTGEPSDAPATSGSPSRTSPQTLSEKQDELSSAASKSGSSKQPQRHEPPVGEVRRTTGRVRVKTAKALDLEQASSGRVQKAPVRKPREKRAARVKKEASTGAGTPSKPTFPNLSSRDSEKPASENDGERASSAPAQISPTSTSNALEGLSTSQKPAEGSATEERTSRDRSGIPALPSNVAPEQLGTAATESQFERPSSSVQKKDEPAGQTEKGQVPQTESATSHGAAAEQISTVSAQVRSSPSTPPENEGRAASQSEKGQDPEKEPSAPSATAAEGTDIPSKKLPSTQSPVAAAAANDAGPAPKSGKAKGPSAAPSAATAAIFGGTTVNSGKRKLKQPSETPQKNAGLVPPLDQVNGRYKERSSTPSNSGEGTTATRRKCQLRQSSKSQDLDAGSAVTSGKEQASSEVPSLAVEESTRTTERKSKEPTSTSSVDDRALVDPEYNDGNAKTPAEYHGDDELHVGRINGSKQEEAFHSRPAVRLPIPDHLKALLVDDWEYVTKNLSLVPLPAAHPVSEILTAYIEEEKLKRRPGSAEWDLLEEVVAGLKEYFDQTLGRILLYRFEREQYFQVRKKMEKGDPKFVDRTASDIYGAEHLCRLFGTSHLSHQSQTFRLLSNSY